VLRTGALNVVYLTVFLDILGFGIVIPMLPLYAKTFQASSFEIGLLMSSYSAAQMIFAPLWGALSDRVGRRPVMLVSVAGSAASYALFAASSSLPMLFVGRTLAGICAANLSTAQAYVADVTAPEKRTRAMGFIGASFGLGFVIGPALGGLSATLGPRAPFVVAAGLCALDLQLAAAFLTEPPRHEARARGRREGLARVMANPQLLLVVALYGLVTFAFANLESVFTLFLHDRFGYGQGEVAYMFVLVGVVMVLVQGGLIGRLSKRFSEPGLIHAGTLLLSAGLILLSMAHSLPVLLPAVLLFSFGNGLNHPSFSALLSRRAGPDHQGAVLGVAAAASSLGRIFGPMFGGLVYDRFGHGAPLLAGGALMALAFLVGFALQPPPRSG
jgi:multidrug resistance protein